MTRRQDRPGRGGLRATALVAGSALAILAGALSAQEHPAPRPVAAALQTRAPAAHARAPQAQAHADSTAPKQSGTLVENGVRLRFSLTPLADTGARFVRAGQSARLRIRLSDAAHRRAHRGRSDGRVAGPSSVRQLTAPRACRERIASYLQQKLAARPVVDLNSYFLLALNRGNSISVIDPFLGFGNSNLYSAVQLPGEGADWALDDGGHALYVTIPQQNLVALVDPGTWTVTHTIAVGTKPMRVRLQPDGARLWVATDVGDSSGVTAIDPSTQRVVAHVPTGRGHHELAFSRDARYLAVTNPDDGTITVIETAGARRAGNVTVGGSPVDIAYSSVRKAMYVVGTDGTISVVDPATLAIRDRMHGSAGLRAIQFDPSGRWGFALNGAMHEAFILDATIDSVRHAIHLPGAPDQVAFTHSFAYIRSADSADVMMVPLRDLLPGQHASAFAEDYSSGSGASDDGSVIALAFPAGTMRPNQFGDPGLAAAIAPAPEHGSHGDAVYIPNPSEKAIYYYHYMEGMPTPSGSIDNYGFEPLATLTVGRHLDETAPGTYDAVVRLPTSGPYDLVFVLDEPRVVHCLPFTVAPNPTLAATQPKKLRVEKMTDPPLRPGTPATIRFRLGEWRSKAMHAGLHVDVEVMNTGGWSRRFTATAAADSTYEVTVQVPRSGVYYLSVAVPSMQKGFRDQDPLVLRTADLVEKEKARKTRRR